MSVTIDGVKGYEYQYKVTVLAALITEADKIELFVEKQGSEDICLLIEDNGEKFNIEIQVKRENNPINIKKILDWLCHFKERKSDSSLLQKLIDNENTISIFVTHSRCSDSTLDLRINELILKKHKSLNLKRKFYDEFVDALKNKKFGTTSLSKEREKFCKSQANTINAIDKLNRVLEKCLILEEFTDEKVDKLIKSILNEKYSIALSNTNKTYLKLIEIVKLGRDNGLDIIKEFKDCLQQEKIGAPSIDKQRIIRDEESILIDKIATDGIILLTGISQCGKTELAKNIANSYVLKGYDYKIFNDIYDLIRFLNSNTSDNKIVILEDPFGHISLNEDYLEIIRKLNDLASNKDDHHLIVITSAKEILDTITYNQIKNFDWIDLTIKSKQIINLFWEDIAEKNNFSADLTKRVIDGINKSNDETLLQFGQLKYLANLGEEQIKNKKYDELEYLARQNYFDIAEDLKVKNRPASDLLSIISLCSNPICKLYYKDLAYILSTESDLISIRDQKMSIINLGNKNVSDFPNYPNNINLSKDIEDAILYLEERGFITTDSDSLLITHPNYYEVGRFLLIEKSYRKQIEKLHLFKKSIGSLNPVNSLLAAKNASFIYDKLRNDAHKAEIIESAFIGLNSIFPSVTDVLLIFLIKNIDSLQERQEEQLIHKIQNGLTTSFYISWYNNIPFISNNEDMSHFFFKGDEKIIQKVQNLINDNIKPDIYDAWFYIISLNNDSKTTKKEIQLLLQFDEGFIREIVVEKAFIYKEILDVNLIQEFFNDEHPSVIFSAIQASLRDWFSLTEELQSSIKNFIIDSLSKIDIAIRTFNLISTFSIDYTHESIYINDFSEEDKIKMWQIWGELFPICFKNVPLNVRFNSSRFCKTIEDSMKYLTTDISLNVLNAWYYRIDNKIKRKMLLDEYEMSIAKDLMQLTLTNSNSRKELFELLVNYNDTNFILSNLKWIIEYWESLDTNEKQMIINLVNSGRVDTRWIKAVLLNSRAQPKEIIELILGDKDLFERDIESILNRFPDELLLDCLHVFCGFPQPLWWLALNYKNMDFWLKIIKYILLNENNIGFDICLKEFVNDGVNGFSTFRKEGTNYWEQICSSTKNKDKLTISLIHNMVQCSCSIDSTKKMWSVLIKSYEENSNIENLIECIIKNIELILFSNVSDFKRVIDHDFLINKIYPALENLKLTNEKIKIVGEKKLKEINMIYEYKLDNWIGEN